MGVYWAIVGSLGLVQDLLQYVPVMTGSVELLLLRLWSILNRWVVANHTVGHASFSTAHGTSARAMGGNGGRGKRAAGKAMADGWRVLTSNGVGWFRGSVSSFVGTIGRTTGSP